MSALFGLSLIGLFCLIGMALRRWIPSLRKNMVPAFVITGFLGSIAMNVGLSGVLYGTLTGTTPTGLALVRILDPRMRTTTMAEMGLMNLPEMLYIPAMLTIAAGFACELGLWAAVGVMAVLTVAYFVIMLLTRTFGKRTWTVQGNDDKETARDPEPSVAS